MSPSRLVDAIELLSRANGEAQVMAGGQSLLVMMNMRLAAPRPADALYGIRGLGDGGGGAIAPPAAIANTVRDALASLGAEVNETPLTPRRVLAAIRQAQAQESSPAPRA